MASAARENASTFAPYIRRAAEFCIEDALILGVLSSSAHAIWALRAGGTLEDRPTWTNTTTFMPFPFPSDDTGLTPALADRIRQLAEQLDAHRKHRQAQHPGLTLTGMYNVLDKLRSQAADRRFRGHAYPVGFGTH
jgi:hypothetical protein